MWIRSNAAAPRQRRARPERAEGSGRERGAALVVVLMFGIGALSLVLLLLTLANGSVKDQAARDRERALQLVLRTGIAASIHEINTDRFNGLTIYDPGQDGVGALLREGPSGAFSGVPVTTSTGLLGRYRTHVEPDPLQPGEHLLVAVAAYPDFANPRQVASARVRIDTVLPRFLGDRQPLSIVGPASAGGPARINAARGAQIDVVDYTISVPASNVSDPAFHDAFVSEILPRGSRANFAGSDPQSPGNLATGVDTITESNPGVVSPEVAGEVAGGIQQLATQSLATGTSLITALEAQGANTSSGSQIPSGDWALPQGTYYMSGDELTMETGAQLTGSGTLVIAGDFDTDSGRLNWDGEVIVVDADPLDGEDVDFTVGSGGRVNVNGTLAVQGQSGGVTYTADSGSRVNVDGTFLMLSGEGTREYNDHGSRTNVNGIMLLLGEGIDFQTASGGGVDVQGSLIMAVPHGAAEGVSEFDLAAGSHSSMVWDDASFERGLANLAGFTELLGLDDDVFPAGAVVYVEGIGRGLLDAQDAAIALGGELGFPPSD